MINERKLKIMLSNDDMIRYDICGFEERLSGENINGCLGDILREIRGRIGFCVDGERLCMQYYPCRDGGCELYITKLDTNDAQDTPVSAEISQPLADESKKKYKSFVKTDDIMTAGVEIFFENINDMISACRAIADIRTDITISSAYISNGSDSTSLLLIPQKTSDRVITLLSEFGTTIKHIPQESSTSVAGNDIKKDKYVMIADDNAIEILSKL